MSILKILISFSLLTLSFIHPTYAEDIISILDTPDTPLQIHKGRFKQGDNPHWASKDIDDSSWEDILLPDNWNKSRRHFQGIGWYRFKLKVSERLIDKPISIVILKSNMAHALYLNGDLIGKSRNLDPPAREWNYPAIYHIPSPLIQYGKENIIAIRLFGFKNSLSGLHSPLLIGDHDKAQSLFDRTMWIRVYSSQVFFFILLAVSINHLMLFYRRPRDQIYLYFGITCLLWAINLSNNFLQYVPIPYLLWEKIVFASIAISVHLFLIFTLRYLGKREARVELINLIIGCIGFLSLSLATRDNLIPISNLWFTFSILILAYITYLLIRACLEGNKDCLILIAGVIIGSLLGIHDLLIHVEILSPSNPHLLCFGIPLILLGVAFSMSNQFARVYNQYERLNIDLENKVNQKTKELIEIEKRLILEDERRRFSEEMHDYVGSLLTKIYTSMERTAIMIKERRALNQIRQRIIRSKEDIAACIAEIKGIIWASETHAKEERLSIISTNIHNYCNEICQDKDIHLSYQYPDTHNNDPLLNEEIFSNLSRIIMSNIIRHSDARNVMVTLIIKEEHIELSIEDDGRGFDPDTVRHGHGLKDMKKRIKEINGQITISSKGERETGTEIRIKIPI